MFSVQHSDAGTTITVLGLKVKLTSGLRLEHVNGGPYGMYDLIKARAGVPFCTRGVLAQHGWTTYNALQSDLLNAKLLMLCWDRRYRDDWRTKSRVPCEILGAPFVHYRRAQGIRIAPDARGTVCFPAHAIREIRPDFDLDAYCAELAALPEEHQPVTICLHPSDILFYHMDKEYQRRGFSTVCAGLDPSRPFYEAFYDILRRHRFATSNVPGSYLFYAVEMGIPFFLMGELPVENNSGVIIDMQLGENRMTDSEIGRRACELFSNTPRDHITEAQRDFILSELGMNDCLSPAELNFALRKAAVAERYEPCVFNRHLKLLKDLLRHPAHARELLRFHRFLMESVRMPQMPQR